MSEDILHGIEEEQTVCHINARTRLMFRDMLNSLGSEVVVGKSKLKYGDAVYKIDMAEFDCLFNRWVTACCEKNIMTKTLSTDCTKKLQWSDELSDVERAWKGMEVLKEIL